MGVLSALLGASGFIKGMFNLVDEATYTDDERAERKIKILKSYEPFKVAQRLLAIGFCYTFLFLVVCCFFASFFVDVEAQKELIKDNLGSVVIVIVGFYFGGGFLEGTISKTGDAVKKHHEAKNKAADQPRDGEKVGSKMMAEKHERERH